MKYDVIMGLALLLSFSPLNLHSQEVASVTLDGVTNFNRLESTIACAGAVKATAVPEIKKLGFAAIINLRQENEAGADLQAEAAAAKASDIRYYWIPFNGAM